MAEENTPITPTNPAPTPAAPATAPTPAPTPASPAGPTNGLAVASLVTGIVAVVSGWVPFWGLLVGAAAVVLGIIGIKKVNGKGMAIAGIITGGLGALQGLLFAVIFVIAIVASSSAVNTAQETLKEQNKDSQSLVESKKDFAKGETAKFGDKFEVKINDVETGFDAGEYYTAADGKEFVRVNVTVKNISDKSEYVSAYSFAVLDNKVAKNNKYTNVTEELDSSDLKPGGSVTGNLVYEVTKGAKDLKLSYERTIYNTETYDTEELTYTLAF